MLYGVIKFPRRFWWVMVSLGWSCVDERLIRYGKDHEERRKRAYGEDTHPRHVVNL